MARIHGQIQRKTTNAEALVQQYEDNSEILLTRKSYEKYAAETIVRAKENNPDLAARLEKSAPINPVTKRPQVTLNKHELRQANNILNQVTKEEVQAKDLARRSAFAGLLTTAQTFNAAMNVFSRFQLGASAYNAQVAGRVIEFENQQKRWDNIKRSVFLAGSAASFAKVGINAFQGTVGLGTFAAVTATTAGQVARIYNENKSLSGERIRQDADAQYHRMVYGDIVVRGNR